ncbi:MAG TPA: hypothetical protein PKO15_15930 [Fibrobacteria bacterium]|nr:hypothetical protein [Fibrobacteria bacterium]HOX53577.1 hypothetical protein [Fibrobacteria bacterium]
MKAIFATATLTLLLVACNDSPTESEKVDTPSTTQRTISPALRAKCTPLEANPAARLAEEPVTMNLKAKGKMEVFTYDTAGTLIGHSLSEASIPDSSDHREIAIQWDGKSGSTYVPTGHYFMFWTLKDSLGATLRQDSTCVGFASNNP